MSYRSRPPICAVCRVRLVTPPLTRCPSCIRLLGLPKRPPNKEAQS